MAAWIKSLMVYKWHLQIGKGQKNNNKLRIRTGEIASVGWNAIID